MHVVTTRRRYKDKTYETHLLRRSVRDGAKVRKETLANLSHLPPEAIEAVRRALAGESLVAAGEGFEIARSLPHGHVAAVAAMAQTLGFPSLLGPAVPSAGHRVRVGRGPGVPPGVQASHDPLVG